jgi:UDP-N-acetylmuramoylalanine-D-glutamate ligase
MVEEALKRGIPVWTEVELAYHLTDAPFIGITGSNGKTTTTTLVYEMLKADSKKALVAGNIGTAQAKWPIRPAETNGSCSAVEFSAHGDLSIQTENRIVIKRI